MNFRSDSNLYNIYLIICKHTTNNTSTDTNTNANVTKTKSKNTKYDSQR